MVAPSARMMCVLRGVRGLVCVCDLFVYAVRLLLIYLDNDLYMS